jgi:4-hydroxy-2-oxoheptanedioate aldolase
VKDFLQECAREHRTAIGVWNTIGDTLVAETIASLRPDYVCVDMQHGSASAGQLVPLLQAVALGGAAPVVRVPDTTPATIMKALDCGASGVIVPLVESAELAAGPSAPSGLPSATGPAIPGTWRRSRVSP